MGLVHHNTALAAFREHGYNYKAVENIMLVQKSETIREHIKYIVIYYTVSGFELPINAYPLISDDNLKGPLIEKI